MRNRCAVVLITLAAVTACTGLPACTNSADADQVIPNDPDYPQQWALPASAAPSLWATVTDASAVPVFLIDTGVAPVPDLATNLAPAVVCTPRCRTAQSPDRTGHGTSVASILAALGNNDQGIAGMAWRAKVQPINIADPTGKPTVPALVNAIDFAGVRGARIVNLSVTLGSDDANISRAISRYPQTLFIVPAGNDGLEIDERDVPVYPCRLPAANVLCVTSTTPSGVPDYSANMGSESVDVAAPGDSLLTYDQRGRLRRVSGTSFAAPLVSGTAALLLAKIPSANTTDLRTALTCSANRLGDGTPILNAELAYQHASGTVPTSCAAG